MAAYIGEGEKLWIMRDLTGEGHATVKEVVFSGFGTGDVHQSINSFTWTPDGALMFSQGLHNYSNVTTPWGGRRLYGAGFWMYRPLRAQLTPYPTGFPLNAWGTVYDDAGQPFTVAGAAGMFWTTPLLVSTEHLIEGRALPNNGQIVKQGMLKYCGIDIPRNAHWPADMHGELVSGGFFENCIYRHKLQQDKANPSGYEAVRQPNLITSSSVAFRPVDVKFGPDGALYISDWYNPIIGHYQASFRHPDRDKTHGRIWRVVKKGSPLVKMPDLGKADEVELLDVLLKQTDRWAEYQAQRLLMGKPKGEVLETMRRCLRDSSKGTLTPRWVYEPKDESACREWRMGLQAQLWFEEAEVKILREAETAPNSSLRALAMRAIGDWSNGSLERQPYIFHGLQKLESHIADEDPRVRLEAIAACSHIPQPESIAIALRALDKPMDSFLDRTLELTVHALAPQWEPALREGKLTLPPKHLAWLLDKKSDGDTLAAVRALLGRTGVPPVATGILPVAQTDAGGGTPPATGKMPVLPDPDSRRALLLLLAKRGTTEDVAAALDAGAKDANLLAQLADLVEAQQTKAPANAEKILKQLGLFGSVMEWNGNPLIPDDLPLQVSRDMKNSDFRYANSTSVSRLIGLWKLAKLAPPLSIFISEAGAPLETKRAALIALARLNAERDLILKISADAQQPYAVRLGAVEALSLNDGTHAAKAALGLMPLAKTEEDMRALLAPFMVKAGRAKLLVTAITETPPSKEAADLATRALIAMGRNEPELSVALNKILGRTGVVMPYDAQWVSSLGNEATVAGNAKHGDEIFHRVSLNCIACHSIGGKGGIIGPQLDALGRGVPVELLVEAVMWPQRQIKEGYVATTVIMKDGRTLVGYKQKESDAELTIRDLASNTMTTLQKAQIQTRTDAGSLMPDGLTASLSREELRDLIAYLASLGK